MVCPHVLYDRLVSNPSVQIGPFIKVGGPETMSAMLHLDRTILPQSAISLLWQSHTSSSCLCSVLGFWISRSVVLQGAASSLPPPPFRGPTSNRADAWEQRMEGFPVHSQSELHTACVALLPGTHAAPTPCRCFPPCLHRARPQHVP